MTPHNHRTYVEGCYRCELGRDEVAATVTTISEHLEAIRDRHALENAGSDSHLCIWCGSDFPCPDRADAVAALALPCCHNAPHGAEIPCSRPIDDEEMCSCGHSRLTHNIGGGCASGLCNCTRSRWGLQVCPHCGLTPDGPGDGRATEAAKLPDPERDS